METIEVLQRLASPWLDTGMLAITYLGDEQAYIALLVIIYLAVSPAIGRRLGVALMLSFFLNFHLKGIVATPRPFELDPAVARGDAAVATAPGAGFPSGHAQGSATFWGYLAWQLRRPGWWAVAAVVIGLVSISRLYLGLHVPVDVLGGVLIGLAVVAAAVGFERYRARLVPDWPVPVWFGLGLLVPLGLHLLLPVTDSALLMGGLAAFLTAPLLIQHQLPATLGGRAAAAGVGLVLVFGALMASRLLPAAVREHALGGYARYLAIGYVGLALAPYLARRLGLSSRPMLAARLDSG